METVELKSLIGKHKLTGVDYSTEAVKIYEWDESLTDSQVIKFCLDGKTYLAMEDPSDGYRSSMKHCIIIDEKPKNKFKAVEVFGIMKPRGYNENEVIQFYDIETAEVVLEVGTENSDDYYPSFVGRWIPENLYVNKGALAKKV